MKKVLPGASTAIKDDDPAPITYRIEVIETSKNHITREKHIYNCYSCRSINELSNEYSVEKVIIASQNKALINLIFAMREDENLISSLKATVRQYQEASAKIMAEIK